MTPAPLVMFASVPVKPLTMALPTPCNASLTGAVGSASGLLHCWSTVLVFVVVPPGPVAVKV